MTNEPDATGELESLKRENESLRESLAKATHEADSYRSAAYQFLDQIFPYTRPTESELHEMLQSDPNESLHDIIGEFKRELNG